MNKTIGRSFNYGFAGNVALHPDIIVGSEMVEGSNDIYFGDPVMATSNGKVQAIDSTFTSDKFVGVASSEIRSAVTVDNMNGVYRENDMASILKRGVISVICQAGNPVKGGKVYVRIDNATSSMKIGGFETSDIPNETVELENCLWASDKDGNNVSSIRLRTINYV